MGQYPRSRAFRVEGDIEGERPVVSCRGLRLLINIMSPSSRHRIMEDYTPKPYFDCFGSCTTVDGQNPALPIIRNIP